MPPTPRHGVIPVMRGLPYAVLLSAIAVAAGHAADDPSLLTTVGAVAEPQAAAAPSPAVQLEAVVIGRYPNGTILIRDDTGATFARPSGPAQVAVGDRVRVVGTRTRGVFIDGVGTATFAPLGAGPPPVPRPVQPEDIVAGACYHDLVTVSGIVRSVRAEREVAALLRLDVGGRPLEVRCDRPLPATLAARLLDAEVRVTGYGAGEANALRQLIRPFLRVVADNAIAILEPAPADPFAAPALPLERVGQGLRSGHRVKVEGVATAPGGTGGGVFLAVGDRGLFVAPAVVNDDVRRIRPGDRVAAVGFATAGPAAVFLDDALVRVTGTGAAPAPQRLPDASINARDWDRYHAATWRDAMPIEVEIEVASRIDRAEAVEIVGTSPPRGIEFRCFVAGRPPAGAVPGSRLRLRGVGRVTATTRDTYSPLPIAFDLWPATPADLAVVRAAPWWTRPDIVKPLAATLAAFVAAAVGAVAWGVLLRRRVRAQAGQLATEIQSRRDAALEFDATLRERNRLAANLHDTLLQTLGGIGYQLDACEGSRASDEAEAKVHFDVARRMVSHASNELHNAVWAMRSLPIRDQSFPDALRTLVERVGEGHAARIDVRTAGSLDDVPEFVAGNVLLIVQEAVLNALRHGRAETIDVRVTDHPQDRAIDVQVRDDGRGFDPAGRQGVEQGHFGIQGMRERAERLGGSIEIDSVPGAGATVHARVLRHEFDAAVGREPAADRPRSGEAQKDWRVLQ